MDSKEIDRPISGTLHSQITQNLAYHRCELVTVTGKTGTDDDLRVRRVARDHKMLIRRDGVHTNNMLGSPTNHLGKRLPDETVNRRLIVGKQVTVEHTRIVDRSLGKMLGNLQAFVVN